MIDPDRTYGCFIDGCRKAATLNVETHPDDTHLCDEHRWIHDEQEWWQS